MLKYLIPTLLLVFLYFILRSPQPDHEPASFSEPQVESKRTASSTPAIVIEPKPNLVTTTKSKKEPYQQPPKGTVEFVLVENRAVAFGDIILGEAKNRDTPEKGFYKPKEIMFWPSTTIPYVIDPDLIDPTRVENALEYFNQNTSIKFIPLQNEEDAGISFESGEEHCYSYLGKIGGHQPIMISDNCNTHEIIHEIMHALGFIHEQSRTDRDAYVQVLWNNIEEKYFLQFAMVPDVFMVPFKDFDFDYHSIMLYKPEYFARDRTLKSLKSTTHKDISPSYGKLSAGDLQKLEKIYGFANN